MSIFDDIKDTGKDVFNKGKKAGQSADPSKILDEIKDEVKKVEKLKDEIKDVPEKIRDEVKDAAEAAARKVKKELHDAIQSQIGKAFKAGLEFAWERVKKTKVLKSFKINVNFSVFTSMVSGGIAVSWDKIGDDKEILLKKIGSLSSSPPNDKESIKDFIKVLAPDSVEFTVSAFSWGVDVDEAIDEVDVWASKIGFS